jgi:hypothetical protein
MPKSGVAALLCVPARIASEIAAMNRNDGDNRKL